MSSGLRKLKLKAKHTPCVHLWAAHAARPFFISHLFLLSMPHRCADKGNLLMHLHCGSTTIALLLLACPAGGHGLPATEAHLAQ